MRGKNKKVGAAEYDRSGGSNDGVTSVAGGGWDTPTGGCDKIEP